MLVWAWEALQRSTIALKPIQPKTNQFNIEHDIVNQNAIRSSPIACLYSFFKWVQTVQLILIASTMGIRATFFPFLFSFLRFTTNRRPCHRTVDVFCGARAEMGATFPTTLQRALIPLRNYLLCPLALALLLILE